jgi:hypothetical protein
MTIINLIIGAFFNADDFEKRIIASLAFDAFIMALVALASNFK